MGRVSRTLCVPVQLPLRLTAARSSMLHTPADRLGIGEDAGLNGFVLAGGGHKLLILIIGNQGRMLVFNRILFSIIWMHLAEEKRT